MLNSNSFFLLLTAKMCQVFLKYPVPVDENGSVSYLKHPHIYKIWDAPVLCWQLSQ